MISMTGRRVKTDMSSCRHVISARHGRHVANITTCHVVSLIADMLAIQQPASAGEAQQERRQCDERGFGSGDATKNNKIMALGGGRGDGQRWRWRQMQVDSKYNNQPNALMATTTTAMMMGQR
jgi:hypothetical protein